MSKIGISGAQGVGKTTILNALRSEDYFKRYSVRNEVTRTVNSYGIDINEKGSDLSQTLIMKEHIYNLVMFDNMLTDRTTLDGLVYTISLYKAGRVTKECLKECTRIFEKTIGMYDYLFYIAPEFALEDDGVRSVSVEWQKEIVDIFENVIYDRNINVVRLSGSVRARVNKIFSAIGVRE